MQEQEYKKGAGAGARSGAGTGAGAGVVAKSNCRSRRPVVGTAVSETVNRL